MCWNKRSRDAAITHVCERSLLYPPHVLVARGTNSDEAIHRCCWRTLLMARWQKQTSFSSQYQQVFAVISVLDRYATISITGRGALRARSFYRALLLPTTSLHNVLISRWCHPVLEEGPNSSWTLCFVLLKSCCCCCCCTHPSAAPLVRPSVRPSSYSIKAGTTLFVSSSRKSVPCLI